MVSAPPVYAAPCECDEVKTGINFYKIDLKVLNAAYSIAFPHSTPINVNKKKRI